MDRFRPLIEAALLNGTPVRGYLSCVVACPYEGKTSPTQLGARTEELLAMGCYQVSLGDTIGVGTPTTTRTMLDAALVATGNRPDLLAVHFHDTL